MTNRWMIASCLCTVLWPWPAGPQPARTDTAAAPVTLFVTVLDQDQRMVAGLTQEQFEIRDNGRLQAITSFSSTPAPIHFVLLLDTSGSMKVILDPAKRAAEQFLNNLSAGDTGVVGGFHQKVTFHPDAGLTGDVPLLKAGLNQLTPGFPSALFDAIDQSIARLRSAPGRRVIVVMTDGEDNISMSRAGDVVKRATAAGVGVWSVGVVNEYLSSPGSVNMATGQRTSYPREMKRTSPDRGLKAMSADTGGNFFLLKNAADWGPTFAAVAKEVHSQYAIEFVPAILDRKEHKLDVRLTTPGLTVRTRKRYLAADPSRR